MWAQRQKYGDIESGVPLYPPETELRWALVRKIYVILALQLAMTAAVAWLVVKVNSVSAFLTAPSGLVLRLVCIVLPFILLWLLSSYYESHPLNLLLLGLFTVSMSFLIGVSCTTTAGNIVLEAALLTAAVVVCLTIYTFWASWRGQDFAFLGPFLFASLTVLIIAGLIQIFFPLGNVGVMIYGAVGSIIFCGYIIYDTDNIIKRFSYDEYIPAVLALYLDILNLFLLLLGLLRDSDN